jgi:hypothetical protein
VFRALIIPSDGLTFLGILRHELYGCAQRTCSFLPNYHPDICYRPLPTNKLLTFILMSHSQLPAASSSNFQLIMNNALDAYETRTKKDLLVHPLASQLEDCDSPAAILTVLEQQVQGLDQSRDGDDRWTKWLGPTVNILCTLSDTLGEGVGLVSFRARASPRSTLLHIHGRYSHPRNQYLSELVFSSPCASFLISLG